MGNPIVGIAYDAPLPDPSSRWIHIITPQVGVPTRLCILGRKAVPVLTHWLTDTKSGKGGRTVPHTTPDDTCPMCVATGQIPRWHAYLACWWAHSARYCLADLTLHAVQSCPDLSPKSGYDLRGMTICLRRIGTTNKSPVKAELEGLRVPDAKLPAEFDVRAALERLWGVRGSEFWRSGGDVDDVQRPV